jgi:ABC-type glycerol-3-phosphate transport system permease component
MTDRSLDRPATMIAAEARPATRRRGPKPATIGLYLLLAVLALFFVLPLVWMLSSSLKEGAAVYTDQGWIPENPTLANF